MWRIIYLFYVEKVGHQAIIGDIAQVSALLCDMKQLPALPALGPAFEPTGVGPEEPCTKPRHHR